MAMEQMTCARSFLGAFSSREHTHPIPMPIMMLQQNKASHRAHLMLLQHLK